MALLTSIDLDDMTSVELEAILVALVSKVKLGRLRRQKTTVLIGAKYAIDLALQRLETVTDAGTKRTVPIRIRNCNEKG